MSDSEDSFDAQPPVIDPYEILDLERDATENQVKSAYRKAALKNHPDKVAPEKSDEAKETFQQIAFAYAILSDPVRRKRYDATGSTSESIVDSDDFDWTSFYRAQFADAVSDDQISKFAAKYKGSDEERDDLLVAFEQCEGDMDEVYERVILSDPLKDDERFRKIIAEAIEKRDIPAFKAFTKESKQRRAARERKARNEAAEAEAYAKKLGVAEKLGMGSSAGTKKGPGNKNEKDSERGLAALIRARQQDRAKTSDDFLERMAAKYGAKEKPAKKGKKRVAEEEEPDEAAFQAAAARLGKPKDKKTRR